MIVIQFTVYPAGIGNEPGVMFDTTRQVHSRLWRQFSWQPQAVMIMASTFPASDEEPNDDGTDGDESPLPTAYNHFYVIDAPGIPVPVLPDLAPTLRIYRANFNEFMRVRFDGERPTGNNVRGSRCSDKYLWHARHKLFDINDDGTLNRVSGNFGPPGAPHQFQDTGSTETNDNDIDLGHIPIGQ